MESSFKLLLHTVLQKKVSVANIFFKIIFGTIATKPSVLDIWRGSGHAVDDPKEFKKPLPITC